MLIFPYVALLFVSVLTHLINNIQKPIEKSIIKKAKDKLALHSAIKIGVVGSYGKTSMKEMLKTVLAQGFNVKATPDNKNTPLGIARFVESLEGDEEVLVFEMGEYYKGDIKNLCLLVNPDIGIITGVNEAHLEKFKNIEASSNTIFEIADFLVNKKNSRLYVNSENRLALERVHQYKNKDSENLSIYTYGEGGVLGILNNKESNLSVVGADTSLSGTSFVLKDNKNEGIVVSSRLIGLHQVGPLSLVAFIAKTLGMKAEKIEIGLKSTSPFEHRMEYKEAEGGVTIIDDSYNGNPDGVRVAINFLKEIKNKRRFYITPGLVELGSMTKEIHKDIGKQLANAGIEKVVLVRNSVTGFINEGLKEALFKGDIIWFDSSLECFKSMGRLTISNDLLLYQNDWPDNYL
jgi:UDP-N-acetylmuramoyl-tripeptide--D-alanyl-D-alanine ligase